MFIISLNAIVILLILVNNCKILIAGLLISITIEVAILKICHVLSKIISINTYVPMRIVILLIVILIEIPAVGLLLYHKCKNVIIILKITASCLMI